METTQQHLLFITACTSGEDGAIHAYRLDLETAQLALLSRTVDIENPFFMALSPDRQCLYAIHEPGEFGAGDNGHVAAYRIVDAAGTLMLINRQPTRGGAACYVTVDATGRTVLAVNYQNGSVLAYPVLEEGSREDESLGVGALGDAVSFIQHQGASVNSERQEGPHAHCFVISPDNQYAYVADLGLDKIMNYHLDAATATLSANQQPFVRTHPGSGPRHFTFHPKQPRAYAINELDSTITLFDYDATSGTLLEQETVSTLPDDFAGTSHCADLKITPDGRFLYGTNRGHESIAAYAIADDGRLTCISIEPSGGQQPQNLAITPDGSLLLCANMAGGCVTVFRIDNVSGKITPTGEPLLTPMPSCIVICS